MLFSTEKSLLFHVVMSYNFSLSFLFKYLKSLKSFHNQNPISIFVLIALNIILYGDFNFPFSRYKKNSIIGQKVYIRLLGYAHCAVLVFFKNFKRNISTNNFIAAENLNSFDIAEV